MLQRWSCSKPVSGQLVIQLEFGFVRSTELNPSFTENTLFLLHWLHFLEKSAFSIRKLLQTLLGIEEYQPCQKRSLRFLVIPSLWLLRVSSFIFQIVFLSECDFLSRAFSPSVRLLLHFYPSHWRKKFYLGSAQVPLCFAFYFSSMLHLIGDISKKDWGSDFQVCT